MKFGSASKNGMNMYNTVPSYCKPRAVMEYASWAKRPGKA
jgi:hypothetical protein